MDRKDNNKKIISLAISLFIVMLLVSGGSFAYWTWVTADSERTGIAFNVSAPDMSASLDGHSVTVTNLIPVSSCTDGTYAIKKQLTLTYENNSTNAGEILGTLSIEEDSFISPYGTPDSDDLSHLHYAVTMSPDNCTAEPLEGMSGTFTETSGQLFSSQKLVGPITPGTNETSMTFYLWIWLDSDYTHQNVGSGVSNDPMQDISFTLVWSGEIKNDLVMPNVPVLDDGMIPVKIANNGTVTTVAEDDSTWYNYDSKEWANVVLVNEEATADIEGSQSREYYKNNLSNNVEVNQSDILAYYVWIPRYKYKVWTTDATTTTNPQIIDIMFEAKEAVPVYGTIVDSWRTHPAFIWDGNTISGMWVGKFETTGSADIPTILPNEQSLREQDIIDQFKTALKFAGGIMDSETLVVTFSGNDTYALTSETDSHMMKNSEWGAVAYLSHSKYGINREIYINNSSDCYTGRSGGKVGGSVNTLAVQFSDDTLSTSESYNSTGYYTWIGEPIDSSGVIGTVNDLTLGTKASTTGNVSGIYDMSGGSQEYVMSLYNDLSWNGSGFTLSTLPANKYYNIYSNTIFTGSYTSNIKLCTLDTCGGHALSETASWYSDRKNFGDAYGAWFIRGGSSKSDAVAGIFYTDSLDGGSRNNYSWRSILVVD